MVTSYEWPLSVGCLACIFVCFFLSFIIAVYLVSRHFNQCEFVWSNLWCCYITYLRLHNARTYTRTHFSRRWLCARTNFYFLREKVLPSSAMCLNELSPTCTQIPTMHSFGGDAMVNGEQKKWTKSTTANLVHIALGPFAEPKYCNLFRWVALLRERDPNAFSVRLLHLQKCEFISLAAMIASQCSWQWFTDFCRRRFLEPPDFVFAVQGPGSHDSRLIWISQCEVCCEGSHRLSHNSDYIRILCMKKFPSNGVSGAHST